MRVRSVILVSSLWFAALAPAAAAAPFKSGMTAAASTLSETVVVKKKGIPGWWSGRHCPPGHWKKGWC